MANTHEERQSSIDRLNKNIEKLANAISHFDENELKRVSFYLLLTINYGINNEVENAYTFNNDNIAIHDVGDKYTVDIGKTLDKLKDYDPYSFSVAHNHPNNILPSKNDFYVFMHNIIFKNMAICGNIGNLYFMKKGKDFHDLIPYKDVDKLQLDSGKLLKIKVYEFIRKSKKDFYKWLSETDQDTREKVYQVFSEIIYSDICKSIKLFDTGFQYYHEGAELNESL